MGSDWLIWGFDTITLEVINSKHSNITTLYAALSRCSPNMIRSEPLRRLTDHMLLLWSLYYIQFNMDVFVYTENSLVLKPSINRHLYIKKIQFDTF